jgi:hypothetical protein
MVTLKEDIVERFKGIQKVALAMDEMFNPCLAQFLN